MTSLRRTRVPLLATAATLLALSACGTDTDPTSATDSPEPSPGTTTATETPTTPPTETPTDTPTASGATAGVYFVGDTPQGPRLFREFQPIQGDPATEVAQLVDGGMALDPDYRTLWPGGTVESVSADESAITVNLAAEAFTDRPDGMPGKQATLAIQQMVYSLQAATQTTAPVQFVRSEGPQTLFGVDVSAPVERADWLDVQSMMSVTTPEQGQAVEGDTLTASGVGSSFEANVLWQVRRGEEVVLEGFTTAEGWMDKLYPWEAEVDMSSLEPGEYTFVASTDDPSGGEGGGPVVDTKDFTIS